MATKEELFEAVRLIKEHCKLYTEYECLLNCPLLQTCNRCFVETPQEWPDPEEGGGEDG